MSVIGFVKWELCERCNYMPCYLWLPLTITQLSSEFDTVWWRPPRIAHPSIWPKLQLGTSSIHMQIGCLCKSRCAYWDGRGSIFLEFVPLHTKWMVLNRPCFSFVLMDFDSRACWSTEHQRFAAYLYNSVVLRWF